MDITLNAPKDRLASRLHDSWTRADLMHWNVLLLFLYAVGMLVFFVAAPFNLDDFWFMDHIRNYYRAQGIICAERAPDLTAAPFPWQELWDTLIWRWNNDNARLGNVVVLPFFLIPVAFTKSLIWICWMYCVYGAIKLIDLNWRRSPLLPLMLFCFTFIIPWRDCQFSVVYGFNYILPTALGIILLRLILNNDNVTHTSLFKIALCSFLFGWWHEGFSIPVIVGLCGVLLLSKHKRNKRYIVALIFTCIGLAIIVTAPSLLLRFTSTIHRPDNQLIPNLPKIFFIQASYIIFAVLTILQIRKYGRIYLVRHPFLTIILIGGIGSLALLLLSMVQLRVCWWTIFLSIIGIMQICLQRYPIFFDKYRRKSILSAVIISFAFMAEIGTTDVYAVKMSQNWQSALEQYADNPEETIFGEVYTYDNVPRFITPMFNIYQYTSSTKTLNTCFIQDEGHPLIIIPEELRYIEEGTGNPLAGNFDVKQYKGRLFRAWNEPIEPPKCGFTDFELDYGFGYVGRPVYFFLFRSEKDGRLYHYLLPIPSLHHASFGNIRGFRTT